jgi:hypothetical protein
VTLYIHSPIRLLGVMLNYLRTGTTLPFLPTQETTVHDNFVSYIQIMPNVPLVCWATNKTQALWPIIIITTTAK